MSQAPAQPTERTRLHALVSAQHQARRVGDMLLVALYDERIKRRIQLIATTPPHQPLPTGA